MGGTDDGIDIIFSPLCVKKFFLLKILRMSLIVTCSRRFTNLISVILSVILSHLCHHSPCPPYINVSPLLIMCEFHLLLGVRFGPVRVGRRKRAMFFCPECFLPDRDDMWPQASKKLVFTLHSDSFLSFAV